MNYVIFGTVYPFLHIIRNKDSFLHISLQVFERFRLVHFLVKKLEFCGLILMKSSKISWNSNKMPALHGTFRFSLGLPRRSINLYNSINVSFEASFSLSTLHKTKFKFSFLHHYSFLKFPIKPS